MSDIPFVLPDGRVLVRLDYFTPTYRRMLHTDSELVLLEDGKRRWSRRAPLIAPRMADDWGDQGLWVDGGGQRIWVRLGKRVGLLDLATGEEVGLAGQVEGELSNPEADAPTLLRLAHHHHLTPPAALLNRSDSGYLGLGWKARLGDSRARADLLAAVEKNQPGALEGLALLGREAVERPMLKTMLNEPYAWAWEAALDRLGSQGDPILCKALSRVDVKYRERTEGLIDHVGVDPNCWQPLLRLAHLKCKGAAERLTRLERSDRDQRLLELFIQEEAGEPPSPTTNYYFEPNFLRRDESLKDAILRYFSQQVYPAVCPAMIAALRKHPDDGRLERVLRRQMQVDFGVNADAWQRWLEQGMGHSIEVKAQLLAEMSEPTALLWQAQMGQLRSSDLVRVPRLQAVWSVCSSISADGQFLINPANSVTAPLPQGQPQAWETKSGKELTQEYPLTQDLRFRWDPLAGRVRDYQKRRELKWLGDVHEVLFNPGEFSFYQGQKSFHFDPATFQFYAYPGDWLVGSTSRSEALILSDGSLKLLDWKTGRELVLQKPADWLDIQATFSADGDWILVAGDESWKILDRQGRRLFEGQGQFALLPPDRSRVLSFSKTRLRITRLRDSLSREIPWSPPDPVDWRFGKTPAFLNGSNELLVDKGSFACVLNADDLKERGRCWHFGDRQSTTSDGKRWSRSDGNNTWIWSAQAAVPHVPPEQQSLLCELWTGMHLRGGMATPLTPAQYEQRISRWRSSGGGSWYDL